MTSASDNFRRLANRFDTIVAAVPAGQWDTPSPCDGWTVTDVLRHVVETERDFLERMQFDLAEVAPDSTHSDAELDDLKAQWATLRHAMEIALDDPTTSAHTYDGYFGLTTFADTVDTFYSTDLVLHGWDIARGAGLTEFEHIDVFEIHRAQGLYEDLGDAIRSPGVFGPPVEVGPGASEQDRFLAWAGRRPTASR